MALVLTSPPAQEPVSLDEVKDHLRVDASDEDTLISSLILTSRLHIETALSLALITQSWSWTLDAWPKSGASVTLPLRPVSVVSAITTLDSEGNAVAVDPAEYELDGDHVPPRLLRLTDAWPKPERKHAGIQIDFTAGFGNTGDDVPAPVRHALLLLIAHWYEHRDPTAIGNGKAPVPTAVSRLLQPYRLARL